MTVFRRIGALTLALAITWPTPASAQLRRLLPKGQPIPTVNVEGPEAWGLNTPTTLVLSAFDFQLVEGTANPVNQLTGTFSCATAECIWVVGLNVASGASVRAIELSACDGDSAKEVQTAMVAGPKVPGPLSDVSPVITTGQVETPGCSNSQMLLPTPLTVDNNSNFYAVFVATESGTNLEWNQVRIRYRLQVSPAPGTATFTDVPVGHPQRQFIEALAASGISGGCGGGNYCPDTPVTRGQMAVFLAAALGLHWPF